jgi:periplasmic divalent cation tolerance protein
MTDKIVVFTMCDSEEEAARIARRLVEKRLAACVNIIGGARSIYRWKGAVEEASEWLLIIKSERALFDELRVEIEVSHSYEVPEAIAIQIVDGAQGYLDWIEHQVKKLHEEEIP